MKGRRRKNRWKKGSGETVKGRERMEEGERKEEGGGGGQSDGMPPCR